MSSVERTMALVGTNRRRDRRVDDDLDRVQLEELTNPLIGTSGARTLFDHEYNLAGQRTSVAADLGGTIWGNTILSGVGDFMNTYSYDGYGRLASVSQGSNGGNAIAPKTATFAYNAANQLTDLRRYNWPSASSAELDVHSRYEYDGAGRLESISHAKSEMAAGETWDGTSTLPTSLQGGSLLAGYFLEYNQENQLINWASYADAFETTFSYDVRDQLTGATHSQISGLTLPRALPSSESYAFDGTGNRELSGTSTSTDGSHNQVQNDGTYTYSYDAEGNQTSRTSIATGAVTEYDFDYHNRLVRVTERASSGGAATSVVEFQYDAFDRRTGKEVDTDGDGDVERATAWAWDGNQVVLQYTDADGDGPAAWKLTNRYLYGEAIDQILADEQLPGDGIEITAATLTTGEVLWPLGDHLGSVRDLVDSSGVIRQHVVYDSFGNRLSESDYDSTGASIASSHASAVDHLFGYTGREWDADVELQYNRARWYDPAQGRWISQDPIGFAAGDANLYRYVGNEPATKTDPSGLVEIDIEISTFIPWDWVNIAPGIELKGDGRGPSAVPGGRFMIKSQLTIETNAAVSVDPEIFSSAAISPSTMSVGCSLPGVGGEYYGWEFTALGKMHPSEPHVERAGNATTFVIQNSGRTPRTFVITAIAPYINYRINGTAETLSNGQVKLTLNFVHDGFPGYEFYVNNGLVYCHDPKKAGQTPLSLLGSGEFSGSVVLYIDPDTGELLQDPEGGQLAR